LIYEKPCALKKRACGFGIGDRFQTPLLEREA